MDASAGQQAKRLQKLYVSDAWVKKQLKPEADAAQPAGSGMPGSVSRATRFNSINPEARAKSDDESGHTTSMARPPLEHHPERWFPAFGKR